MEFWILEKERKGFGETNSSSTHSFHYSKNKDEGSKERIKELLAEHLWENGGYLRPFDTTKEFGWEKETYCDYKIVWNYILAGISENYGGAVKGRKEFIELLSEFLEVSKENIEWDNSIDFGYIDHQSVEVAFEMVEELKEGKWAETFNGTLVTGNDNDEDCCMFGYC